MFCFSKQLLEQEEVDVVHQLDKERGVTVEDFKLIKLHTANCMFMLMHFGCFAFWELGFSLLFTVECIGLCCCKFLIGNLKLLER